MTNARIRLCSRLRVGTAACLLVPLAGVATAAPSNGGENPAKADTAVLAHLNAAIGWYQHIEGASRWVVRPSDGVYYDAARTLALQALQTAFNAAAAQAALLAPPPPGPGKGPSPETRRPSLLNSADIAGRIDELRLEIAETDARLKGASPQETAPLRLRQEELTEEMNFEAGLASAIAKLPAAPDEGPSQTAAGTTFAEQVRDLRKMVPEIDVQGGTTKAAAPAVSGTGSTTGLIARADALFTVVRGIRDLDGLVAETGRLEGQERQIALPLQAALRGILREGSEAADRAQNGNSSEIAGAGGDFRRLSGRFKALSAAGIPLREEASDLEESRRNFAEWKSSLDDQYGTIAHALLFRAAAVVTALAGLLGLSGLWRRAAFRYVHDSRRRRQILLIRRIVTGSLIALLLAMGLVNDFGSLATFVGFITAGIAVALQTIIVSVAAYFFIGGRYGIRVGDRITVGGVTGEVIDIGLVRFYMMELVGDVSDLHPTGRMVMFANSVLLQTTPIFKPVPGIDYLWHEAVFSLKQECDPTVARDRLLAVVNRLYGEYRSDLEQQHSQAERLVDLRLTVPEPVALIRPDSTGFQLVIRYPVKTERAREIDGLLAGRLREAVKKDPQLAEALSGSPQIHTVLSR